MNIDISKPTHIVGLQEHSLKGFQDFLFENISWDGQVKAEYGQSKKNTVLLELPVRIRREITIERLDAALDTQIDFELVYRQDIGMLVSSLALDTQHLLTIDDQDVDLWSVDSELGFLPHHDRNHLKKLMRTCDDLFYTWIREVKRYLERLTSCPIHPKVQDKVRQIVGHAELVPKSFH